LTFFSELEMVRTFEKTENGLTFFWEDGLARKEKTQALNEGFWSFFSQLEVGDGFNASQSPRASDLTMGQWRANQKKRKDVLHFLGLQTDDDVGVWSPPPKRPRV
jgi:hypothetical protein